MAGYYRFTVLFSIDLSLQLCLLSRIRLKPCDQYIKNCILARAMMFGVLIKAET